MRPRLVRTTRPRKGLPLAENLALDGKPHAILSPRFLGDLVPRLIAPPKEKQPCRNHPVGHLFNIHRTIFVSRDRIKCAISAPKQHLPFHRLTQPSLIDFVDCCVNPSLFGPPAKTMDRLDHKKQVLHLCSCEFSSQRDLYALAYAFCDHGGQHHL